MVFLLPMVFKPSEVAICHPILSTRTTTLYGLTYTFKKFSAHYPSHTYLINVDGLKMKTQRIIRKFNTKYNELIMKYHLPQALSNLTQQVSTTLTAPQQQEFERIDRLRTQCLLRAEKTCRKFKTGNIEFSPTIQL